jgi:hypothetical protein
MKNLIKFLVGLLLMAVAFQSFAGLRKPDKKDFGEKTCLYVAYEKPMIAPVGIHGLRVFRLCKPQNYAIYKLPATRDARKNARKARDRLLCGSEKR